MKNAREKPAAKRGGPARDVDAYLAGVAAFKDHLSFFPGTSLEAFVLDLKGFETTKGGIHFTPEHPLPAALVKKIIKARIKQIEAGGRR